MAWLRDRLQAFELWAGDGFKAPQDKRRRRPCNERLINFQLAGCTRNPAGVLPRPAAAHAAPLTPAVHRPDSFMQHAVRQFTPCEALSVVACACEHACLQTSSARVARLEHARHKQTAGSWQIGQQQAAWQCGKWGQLSNAACNGT